MIVFPNAKINLGLNITGKRPDGYHNLETVFYPVAWEDALEVTVARSESNDKCNLYLSGKKLADNTGDNLVVRAYNLLDKLFNLPSVDIHLYKNIPAGAGLGGGSSDAAYMLRLLNDMFDLKLTTAQLEEYAVSIGADCPFFINNKPVFAEGTGNIFSPLSLSLSGYQIVIIKPDVFVSTREAFAQVTIKTPERSIKEIINLPVAEWKNNLINDFEDSVFPIHPEIRELKEYLYAQGALYASMSGSGSSVYGLFEPDTDLPEITHNERCDFFQGNLM